MRVLLVEDNPGDAGLLQAALSEDDSSPFEIEKSVNLSEGLAALAREGFEVVLLDLFLPDSSGMETLRRVVTAAPHVPIIVLTGLNDRETAVQTLQEGAQDYILKDRLDGTLLRNSIQYAVERNRLLQKVRESEERYFLAAQGSNDGLWDWNLKTGIVYFSPRWKLMLGFAENEIGSDSEEWFSRVHPEDLPRLRKDLADHLAGQTPNFSNEHRIRHKDEGYRWVLSRGQAVHDETNAATRIAGSFTDITAHRNLEEQLAYQAYYDPLTCLPNRTLFIDDLQRSLARLKRHPEDFFAVFFLDLDRLKFINDSLGHPAGDVLLVEFARRLVSSVRPVDLVARIGGDEFTILLDDLKDAKEALAIADRIMQALREPFLIYGNEVISTVSIGIAYSNCGRASAAELIEAADTAMYQAKTLGKGRYEVFEETMSIQAPKSLQLEHDLRRAIHKQEFLNLYEPILDLRTDRIVGAEVLLRWQHPQRGLLTPADFAATAEETGLMGAINLVMLKTACIQNKAWHSLGLQDFFISVNFPPSQLQRDVVVRLVRKMLEETGIPPAQIEVQVPAHLAMGETFLLPPTLMDLSRLGVGLALTHFTSGNGTLSEIRNSPIRNVKVEAEIVRRLGNGPLNSPKADTIAGIAHGLKIKVTALGVESLEQAEFLKGTGWDEVQGPYFSPPLTADRLTRLLEERKMLTA